MELDRAARYLEVFLCLAWILVFHLRLRSVHIDAGRDTMTASLQAAVGPIRIAATVLLVVGAVLWLEGPTQPYAHALSISSMLVWGITFAIPRLAGPRRV